mgnify:CR=1 FL=1
MPSEYSNTFQSKSLWRLFHNYFAFVYSFLGLSIGALCCLFCCCFWFVCFVFIAIHFFFLFVSFCIYLFFISFDRSSHKFAQLAFYFSCFLLFLHFLFPCCLFRFLPTVVIPVKVSAPIVLLLEKRWRSIWKIYCRVIRIIPKPSFLYSLQRFL